MNAALLMIGLNLAAASPEEGPLGLADLADYPDALAPAPGVRAVAVGFRDLWDRPDEFRGRRVRVEGRLERRFHRPAVGRLPALSEGWIVTADDNPFCAVYPTPKSETATGTWVRFEGTFLRRLRYEGGDGDRLAPLIVGGAPPVAREADRPTSRGWTHLDWLIGGAAALVVVAVLGLLRLRRPARRPERIGPAPEFFDEGRPEAGRDRPE